MNTQTHYGTLGLAPNAPPEVIRAAYRALVLIHHPDKTLQCTPSERVSHAAVFRDIQEAYDVLNNPSRKATYDAAQSQHNTVIADSSVCHHHTTPCNNADSPSTPKRRAPIKLTTPEEKTTMIAKARQQIEYLHEQRAKRDLEESDLDVGSLKSLIQVWDDLAEENTLDPPLKAHCAIRRHEYEQKLIERDRQREEWLSKTATSEHVPSTPATNPQRPATPNAPNAPAPHRSQATTLRSAATVIAAASLPRSQRVEQRKGAEVERTAAAAARAVARSTAKSQRDAAKQAIQDKKVTSVRADKEKQRARMYEQAVGDAERIAQARAKVGSAPLDAVERSISDNRADPTATLNEAPLPRADPPASWKDNVQQATKPNVKKRCGRCGTEHATFGEWKKCNMQAR